MESKELKFYQLFENFITSEFESDKKIMVKHLKSLLDLDFAWGVILWDYLATSREQSFITNPKKATTVGDSMLSVFYEKASVKCTKAVIENPAIRRAVYQYSTLAGTNHSFEVLADLLVGNKVEAADEILKTLFKNEKVHFGKIMKNSLERLFIDLLKKNPTKIDMNKKVAAMFLNHVRKIKTEEKALLEQRIREIY